jgi:hypothetical protein
VTVSSERDILPIWAGEHGDGEGAEYWLRIPAEIKFRYASRADWAHRQGPRASTPRHRSRPLCGHFPTEQVALKCLYLALMGLDPTGKGRGR